MSALDPGNIIYKVMYWGLVALAASYSKTGMVGGAVVVQSPEKDERLRVVVADVTKTLAGKTPTEIVDQCGAQRGRVANRESFAVISLRV